MEGNCHNQHNFRRNGEFLYIWCAYRQTSVDMISYRSLRNAEDYGDNSIELKYFRGVTFSVCLSPRRFAI